MVEFLQNQVGELPRKHIHLNVSDEVYGWQWNFAVSNQSRYEMDLSYFRGVERFFSLTGFEVNRSLDFKQQTSAGELSKGMPCIELLSAANR